LLGMLPDAVARLIGSGSALWRSGANLQVQAAGMPASLALKVTGDLGDLRLEASPMLDLAAGKWAGSLTLRHPGAPRFAEALGMLSAASWLGDGSLSLVAQLSGAGGRLAADSFDLTAGTLHAAGALALQRTERGSSVTGRVSAEVLPLPLPYLRSPDPLPISGLPGWEGSVKLAAGRVLLGQSPALEQATGTLVLANGLVRIEGLTGRLGGGAVSLTLGLDGRTEPPAWTLTGQISDAVLSGPLFDLPLDLTAGVVSGSATLRAAGHSPAALLATLTGEMSLTVRDGSLAGVGLARMNGSLRDAEVVAGMNGGSTPFDRLAVTAGLDHGDVRMDGTRLEGPAGGIVFAGVIDLPGAMADLRLSVSPAVPEPPSIGLWLTGPFDEMRRTPELAGLILWHGEHPTP